MAANFGYVKLPSYVVPEGVDQNAVNGLSNALTQIRKARVENIELDQGQQKIDLAKNADHRSGEKHAQDMQDNLVKSLALQSQRIEDSLPAGDPRRAQAVGRLVNSHPMLRPMLEKYGQNPDDYDNVPKFFLAQAGLYKTKDALEKEKVDRDYKVQLTDTSKANAEYLRGAKTQMAEAQAQAALGRSAGRMTDAETRKRKLEADILERFGPDPDKYTPQHWEELNKPESGIIWTAAGGVQIPYENRHEFLQMAQLRRGAGSDAEDQAIVDDLLKRGIKPHFIEEALKQRALDRAFGKRSPGHMHDVEGEKYSQPDARIPKAKPTAPKQLTDTEKGMAVSAYQNWAKAMDVLVGPISKEVRDKDGNLDLLNSPRDTSKGYSAPTIALGESEIMGVPVGPWIGKATGGGGPLITNEAMKNAQAAAMDLSYFLSGKQIGNAEQLRLIKQYVPGPTDPVEMRKAKMERGLRFFQNLQKIHDTKGPGGVMAHIREAIGDDKEGSGRPSSPDQVPGQTAPAQQKRGATPQGEAPRAAGSERAKRFEQAREAIRGGADRSAVEKMLRDLGIDPTGL